MTARILSALATASLTSAMLVAQNAPDLEAPVRLKAGDEFVDTGEYSAHAGPLFADYDGDGKGDLLVGNFRGHVQVYRNVGSAEAPEFESKGLLEADGEILKIKNW